MPGRILVLLLVLMVPCSEVKAAGNPLAFPEPPGSTPTGFVVSGRQAIAVADRSKKVREERAKGALVVRTAAAPGIRRWLVSYYRGQTEVARAEVDGRTGRLAGTVWTGPQVQWPIARGTPSAFRDRLDIAMLVLCVLFVLPFIDPRRPRRLLHLDVVVLVSFELSLLLFNRGHIQASVPLEYPPLLYLLGRLAWIGFRGRAESEPAAPWASNRLLAVGLVAIMALRVAFNAAWGEVGDVGYAGLFGADSLHHGWNLYVNHPTHLDTYGPVNYLLYLPFEAIFPFDAGYSRDALPGAHAASLVFDLAVVLLLMVAGRRLAPGARGRRMGLLLAYGWAAFPFAFLPLAISANDAIVPVFILLALLALPSAVGRGAALGFGAAAKFAPLGLIPLFASGIERDRRRAAVCIAVALGVFVLVFLPYVHQSGFGKVWDSTIGFQTSRTSPFTLWGLHPSLGWLHTVVQAGVVGLIAASLWFPRERDTIRIAALTAAILLAVQMAGNYWAHTYVMWFAAPAFVAIFGRYATAERLPVRSAASSSVSGK